MNGTRRALLGGIAAGLGVAVVGQVRAAPLGIPRRDIEDVYQDMFGARRPEPGGMTLEVSPLVENGNSVPISVTADFPDDPPTQLHLIMPRNPEAWGSTFRFQAPALTQVSTRVRLSGTQNLTAVAEWPDGRLRAVAVSVMVTLGACIDENFPQYFD